MNQSEGLLTLYSLKLLLKLSKKEAYRKKNKTFNVDLYTAIFMSTASMRQMDLQFIKGKQEAIDFHESITASNIHGPKIQFWGLSLP